MAAIISRYIFNLSQVLISVDLDNLGKAILVVLGLVVDKKKLIYDNDLKMLARCKKPLHLHTKSFCVT